MGETTEDESPLIQALPPATDYLTYLTIIEYNLTPESLPTLHKVLQDETLTTNIGWDLVHLLVPLLPESEECLRDISRLGNPREVILKITESLRLIEYDLDQDEESHELQDGTPIAATSTYPSKTAPTSDSALEPASTQMVELPPPLPLPVQQFISLLSMMAVIQPRIKTKYPSRFLSTTLQAVLASFSNSSTHREDMIDAIVSAVKLLGSIGRPSLPSRTSSGSVPTSKTLGVKTVAPDPEGITSDPHVEEVQMQSKLLQSFVTHVVEEYVLNLPKDDDIPGMAWCSRIMEKLHDDRTIPFTTTFTQQFADDDTLSRRTDALGRLLALSKDLKLRDEELLAAAITVEKATPTTQEEDDPPTSADDIPLSRLGSAILLTARQVSSILYDAHTPTDGNGALSIFPEHAQLVQTCLSSHAFGSGTLGTEPESLIDAILALGIVCLEANTMGEPTSDEDFTEYLQIVALLSSNCPNPNLRGHAHYLTSTVLRSQPSDNVRLGFIRDTLEHCPFENLKVSAVGWIKGEIIEANPPRPGAESELGDHDHEATSIFSTPLALDNLAPLLFPSLREALITAPAPEAWQTYQTNISFYLASLNFMYLLSCAEHLHDNLGVAELWKDVDVTANFVQPLRDVSTRFRTELKSSGALKQECSPAVLAELNVLDGTLDRVARTASLFDSANER